MTNIQSFACSLLFLSFAFAQEQSTTKPAANPLDRGRGAVEAFEKADQADPPQPGQIVFCGSSTIIKWTTLKEDMQGLDVLNRGVGGWVILDVVRYADRIVLKYQPRTIVFYAGDNDLASAKSLPPDEVMAGFRTFVNMVHQTLPTTKIVYLSIKPSPSRMKYIEAQKAANAIAKEIAGKDDRVTYVDVFTPMLDDSGQPKPELYVKDRLHLSPAGYAILTQEVLPVLKRLDAQK